MVQGGLIDQAIAMFCQRAGHCGGSTRARALAQPLRALARKAMDPLAQGGRGQRTRIGDGWQAGAFDDCTDRLGATEDAGFCGLLYEGVSRRQGIIGQVQLEGPPAGGSTIKYYKNRP
jgi:hypothetical protein